VVASGEGDEPFPAAGGGCAAFPEFCRRGLSSSDLLTEGSKSAEMCVGTMLIRYAALVNSSSGGVSGSVRNEAAVRDLRHRDVSGGGPLPTDDLAVSAPPVTGVSGVAALGPQGLSPLAGPCLAGSPAHGSSS